MDAREVIGDNEEMLRSAMEGMRKNLWTALPVIVTEDSDGHIVTVQPSIQGINTDQTGKQTRVNLPLLQDVPIHFPGGSDVVMTHPVKKDDEGMVVFMSRNQDSWYQSGGVQPPLDTRMHHLSDARYIPGGRSLPNKLDNVSTTAHEIRSVDGQHKVSLDPAVGVSVNTTKATTITASNNVNIHSAQQVNINAQQGLGITAPGTNPIVGTLTITGDIVLNGISLANHRHGGVTAGGDDTGPPVPGS